ncbi:entericidin A/B family lipoprotein [Coxiella-like endosymbiont]
MLFHGLGQDLQAGGKAISHSD